MQYGKKYRMKFFICFLLLAGISCSKKIIPGSSESRKNITQELAILCYNIRHANPPSKPNEIDLQAIANVIKKQKPDIVALQEVDVHTNRSGPGINQAKELGRLTGMKSWFAKAIDYDGGEYGVAILSKYPIENMKNTPLPTAEGTNGEHRTLATAIVTLPRNKKILFACTHLDAQVNDTNRLLQINKILKILKMETLPVIIAGDFNATPSSKVIGTLDNYFTRTCISGCQFTIPVIVPTKTIDYIAFAPASSFVIKDHKVIDEKYASDHLPVLSVLQVLQGRKE